MDKSWSERFLDAGNDDGYDVVVVGSGYGGSVAACRMSMAGFNVCLLEKGRRWEAHDFPTNVFKMCSATRFEDTETGLSFGPKDGLFQVRHQDDAAAITACGLGGGSLVNAGVILPLSARVRRDPKWPKAWEKDWNMCQGSALDMLGVQTVPTVFQNSKVMEAVVGEEYDSNGHNPINLSINFDIEEQVSDSKRSRESGSCLACGNCLSGCPYNAKNSTDKTYLASAIKAGCTIKTECEVQHVVRNKHGACNEGVRSTRGGRRQWLVFLSDFEHIAADIVILSAGVFGTTKILFQSQLRGLQISPKLGSGLSCNGNNVAYLSQASAPLNSFGLNRKQFSSIPFQERPGPSISSTYTSSLGFTIQSAVIPTAYPSFFFKGPATYKVHSNNWFLFAVLDWLKNVINTKSNHEMAMNVIGHDENDGMLMFDRETNRLLFQPPRDRLLPRKIEAFGKLARKLGGVLLMSRYRSSSVHHLGGCIAASDVSAGVCNPDGQVYDTTSPTGVHPGLYVCDASLIPCSVGVNPTLTITAVAEHVSRNLTRDSIEHLGNVLGRRFEESGQITKFKMEKSSNSEVTTTETMRGQIGGALCTAHLKLRFRTSNSADKRDTTVGISHPLLRGRVGGYIKCWTIEVDKMYVIHGEVDLCATDVRTPYTQYMHYRLLVAASSGSRYILEGKKIMNPYLLALHAWTESTTLNVSLRKVSSNELGDDAMDLKGKLHISPFELLRSICALKGRSRIEFALLLMQSLLRTYILQSPRSSHIDLSPIESPQETYPSSTTHEIKTEDGFTICCQHWESSHGHQEHKLERKLCPVLLINGYTTESYCLPTENNDLVRTLLKDGHDIWLLQARLSVSNPSNSFSIEDIGRKDIPAAINKIIEFYGNGSIKVHIVAHCVGGLAIHIALMGGHVSAKNIASLSCSNSSMFFKLTTSSSVKMWLPLLPISMVVLGRNKILPMLQTSSVSFRHGLLKFIARLLPLYERCTCDECEVFSGIFGNTFWHQNISHSMHHWMNKQYLTCLPMAAFPHLRKICNAGFIVDGNGNNSYLIHPERMPLPTLYISGGRTLLVTPETSFLANKYMRLHQPRYRHERAVIDGFGHSDLLIGEESHQKVFPHIQRHIKLGEEEARCLKRHVENRCMKEALAWCADPHQNEVWFEAWIVSMIVVVLFFYLLY